jgi:predicted aspartyl protease
VIFPYIGYEVEDAHAANGTSVIYRPIVPVLFVGERRAADFRGLLDTGADETIISQEMAEAIGAKLIPGARNRIVSAGGDVPLTYARVQIEVELGDDNLTWNAIVGVAEQGWEEALLGFRGFLEYFDVLFLGEALQVEISRNRRILLSL